MRNPNTSARCFAALVLAIALGVLAVAQGAVGTVRGQVSDPSAASVPGATITLTDGKTARQAKTDNLGMYTISNLPPGSYNVRVQAKGFADYQTQGLNVAGGQMTYDVSMVVATEAASVTVSTDAGTISTDPSQNVGAIVLKGDDLKMLSDDPDDLASDLQALAGPAAGPNGGQIFIDGFSGGQLPPKESIREIRINSNPFSAEYDRMGFGRIEIFTRPGTDKFRGQTFFNFGNKIFNTRNPFVYGEVPDFQQEMFGGNLSGPLGKKASFFIDVNRRMIDENALVVAQTLDSGFNIVPFNGSIVTPIRRTEVNPRIDYAINPNNTLVFRYEWQNNSSQNQGVGNFTLPALATNSSSTEHQVQATETAVIGTRMINEVRFQYLGTRSDQTGKSNGPTINVQSAFVGGGASISQNMTNSDRYEIQENVSLSRGVHQIKFGGRFRDSNQDSLSSSNYNGSFTFAGGRVPALNANNQVLLDSNGQPVLADLTSIQIYRQTQILLSQGLTPQQVRGLGYGPNQFNITGGIPTSGISQFDAGVFFQDDWRLKPNITLSMGVRYESQTNIGDHGDIAPRVGIAWAPGAKKGTQPKTVIRAGGGIFYDRFSDAYTLDSIRLNGVTQQQFVIPNPDFYPNVPSTVSLAAAKLPQAIRTIDNHILAPRMTQGVIGFDRQLPFKISLSMNYAYTRGTHQLMSRNINAPLQGTYNPAIPGSGVRPYGAAAGDIYQYESAGIFKQNQLIANVQARLSPKYTLFGFYTYGHASSNTDGAGGFPSNQYDYSSDYGRAAFDVRHRAFIGGSIMAPGKIQFNPFIIMSSAPPFNITIGRDLNGDGQFTDRPAFATDLSRPSVIRTQWGNFDINPVAGQTIIPRNYGTAHPNYSANLRVSRSWGFGERKTAQADSPFGGFGGPGGPGGGGGGGPRGGGGPGGGGPPPGMGGGGPGGMRGMFGGGGAGNKRFVLTASASARNALNIVNLAPPSGNLTSPTFGVSTSTGGGGFGGPGGGGPGGGGAAGNRRIEFSLRLAF